MEVYVNPEDLTKLYGTIIFIRTAQGSKSERLAPFLYQNRDVEFLRLFLKNDNPFENNGLLQYDGRFVAITGSILPSGVFLVETIDQFELPESFVDSNQN